MASGIRILRVFCLLNCCHVFLIGDVAAAAQSNDTWLLRTGFSLDLGTGPPSLSQTRITMTLSDFYSTQASGRGAAFADLDPLENVQVKAVAEAQASENFISGISDVKQMPILSFTQQASSLSSLPNSQVSPALVDAISNTGFGVLLNDFHPVNGTWEPGVVQISNAAVGNQQSEIEFSKPSYENTLNMSVRNWKKYLASENDHRVIICQGQSTDGNRLEIGVPVNHAFLAVAGNITRVTEFNIDVPVAVSEGLSFISYEFLSSEGPDVYIGRSYDDLIVQVHQQNLDSVAAVSRLAAKLHDFGFAYPKSKKIHGFTQRLANFECLKYKSS